MRTALAIVLIGLVATLAQAADMCSIAADRSTESYDFLLQHVPAIERDVGIIKTRADFNETAVINRITVHIDGNFEEQDTRIDKRFDEHSFFMFMFGFTGMILGGGIVGMLAHWRGAK